VSADCSLEDQIRISNQQHTSASVHIPLGALSVQILHGLRYMHEQMKQVHRDIKPANILLTSEGLVKLSDFGVSKQLDSTADVAMTQVGSTAYMAPERLKGEAYSYPSDVWSVGVVLLEMLLGLHPYTSTATSFVAIFKAICDAAPPPPPEGTPAEQAMLVEQCLQQDPDARPAVGALVDGPWLQLVGSKDVRAPVIKWLRQNAATSKGKGWDLSSFEWLRRRAGSVTVAGSGESMTQRSTDDASPKWQKKKRVPSGSSGQGSAALAVRTLKAMKKSVWWAEPYARDLQVHSDSEGPKELVTIHPRSGAVTNRWDAQQLLGVAVDGKSVILSLPGGNFRTPCVLDVQMLSEEPADCLARELGWEPGRAENPPVLPSDSGETFQFRHD